MAAVNHSLIFEEAIRFSPVLARALRCPIAALFLSQAVYWQLVAGEGKDFYKARDAKRDKEGNPLPPLNRTEQSWEWETGLTRSQQERARKILRKLDLLKEKKMGCPQRLYYCVNISAVEKLVSIELSKSRSHPLTRLDSAAKKAPKAHAYGSIPPHSTKNSNNYSTSSRKVEPTADVHSHSFQLTKEIGTQSTKSWPRNIIGIQCWHEEDSNHAQRLVAQYGSDLVTQAVSILISKDSLPLPSRVAKQLLAMAKTTRAATDAKEKARMEAADERAADEEKQHIEKVKNAIDALSQEDRSAFINRYLSLKEGMENSKSYDQSTGEFKAKNEHLRFNFWLRHEISIQLRNSSNSSPNLNDGGL